MAEERGFRLEVEVEITLIVEGLPGKEVQTFRVFISNDCLIRSPSRKLIWSSLVRCCLPCPTRYSVLKLGRLSGLGSHPCAASGMEISPERYRVAKAVSS